MFGSVHEYYPGHLESAGQSCGASGPAVGVCVSGSVHDQRALLSVWQGRASGSESPQGNAWEMHSQNLDKDICSTHKKEIKKKTFGKTQLLCFFIERSRRQNSC